jgi:hypothetical protein
MDNIVGQLELISLNKHYYIIRIGDAEIAILVDKDNYDLVDNEDNIEMINLDLELNENVRWMKKHLICFHPTSISDINQFEESETAKTVRIRRFETKIYSERCFSIVDISFQKRVCLIFKREGYEYDNTPELMGTISSKEILNVIRCLRNWSAALIKLKEVRLDHEEIIKKWFYLSLSVEIMTYIVLSVGLLGDFEIFDWQFIVITVFGLLLISLTIYRTELYRKQVIRTLNKKFPMILINSDDNTLFTQLYEIAEIIGKHKKDGGRMIGYIDSVSS